MNVVALGLTTLDVVHHTDAPIVLGGKSVSTSVELVAGGPAANAAVTIAALLGRADLVTALGSGSAADTVDADLAAHSVRVHDCAPYSGWSPPVASCIIDGTGERTVVSPGAANTTFTLTADAADAVADARVLLLDGHHPGLAEQAMVIRPADAVTVLDAGSVKPRAEEWLPRVDVLAASRDYADQLGLTAQQVCARGLAAGCSAVIVTQGAEPVVWQAAGGQLAQHRVTPVDARDTLGAGDVFHGALAAELAVALASPDPSGRRTWVDTLTSGVAAAAEIATRRVTMLGARRWLAEL
ncbi:MAG: PfkB family carbohydrate kinase [Actinomycetales bacterium]